MKLLNRFAKDEQGAALVESGLLVGLIAVVCIGVVTNLGQNVSGVFSTVNADIQAVIASI